VFCFPVGYFDSDFDFGELRAGRASCQLKLKSQLEISDMENEFPTSRTSNCKLSLSLALACICMQPARQAGCRWLQFAGWTLAR
jgi:hypothetical protein